MTTRIAATAVFAALLATAARADYCAPLTVEATAAFAQDSNGLAVIPATLGSESEPMLIDTSSAISEISADTVTALHLRTFANQFGPYNPSGNYNEPAAVVSPFTIDNASTKSLVFRVSTMPREAAGTIATDILSSYDVELDFGGGKFKLLSPEHCFGKVVYWQASAIAVVPMTVLSDGRIVVSVTVDGHPMRALLDTASLVSKIGADTAHGQLGVSSGGRTHTFGSLAFEGVQVSSPPLKIVQTLSDASYRPVPPEDADMTLGMDVLQHLHLYIAYKEQPLYVTPR